MGDSKTQRVDSALSSLIDRIVPNSTAEDETTTDEKRDEALEWAKSVIDGHVNFSIRQDHSTDVPYSRAKPEVVSDVNHASDLIKKKRRLLAHIRHM